MVVYDCLDVVDYFIYVGVGFGWVVMFDVELFECFVEKFIDGMCGVLLVWFYFGCVVEYGVVEVKGFLFEWCGE